LQRIFAADSLQICCSQNRKTEDFRHERRNSLRISCRCSENGAIGEDFRGFGWLPFRAWQRRSSRFSRLEATPADRLNEIAVGLTLRLTT